MPGAANVFAPPPMIAPPAITTAPPSVPVSDSTGGIPDPATFVSDLANRLTAEIHKAVQGQDEVISAALVCLLTGGHGLFEGVPGTAKTLLMRSIAAACSAEFKRIQFTPDLMPSD
ncbi:MAG: MoxR family ATPase, partial [Armatimonadetes bacterium]|nr:MoxR family ATPase [Armatimonadota bacterium]